MKEEEEEVGGKGVTEGGKQAGGEGEGELPQLPRLHTTYDRAAPLSRFSPPPFPHLYPALVVAGNRALSRGPPTRQIYARNARFECLEKRFAFE